MNRFVFVFFVFSVIYFITLNFFYLSLQVLAFKGSIRRLKEARYTNFGLLSASYLTPPISIVIPAFNEEVNITNAVYSAVKSNYPEFEVIVVNDGSTDKTLSILQEEFQLVVRDVFYRDVLPTQPVRNVYQSVTWPNLWIIDKEKGGKADSVNAGANMARFRYITDSDADSIFDPDGLIRIIRLVNLDPQQAVGVGGQIRVGNGLTVEKGEVTSMHLPPDLLPKLQIVEYLGSFLGNRTGWSELNSVLVIAGAFGLWRRDVLLELGGMTTETTHEDIEYTFRLHEHFRRERKPYRLLFIPDPIVWTEVPATWKGIFTQRRRWQRVVNEVFWRYRRMFLNPRYGVVGLIAMPYTLVYEILGPFIELLSYLVVFVLVVTGLIPISAFLLFLLVSFGLTTVVRAASMFVEQYSFRAFPMSAIFKLLFMAILENLGYRQALSIVRIQAMFDWLSGEKSWKQVERRGL